MRRILHWTGVLTTLMILLATSVIAWSSDLTVLAIIPTSGTYVGEFTPIVEALEDRGATVVVTAAVLSDARVYTFEDESYVWDTTTVDIAFSDVVVEEYDAIFIPGGNGVLAVGFDEEAKRIVREAVALGLPIAAICGGVDVMVQHGIAKGRQVCSEQTDPWFVHQGLARKAPTRVWVSEGERWKSTLVTAAGPEDVPVFIREFLKVLGL